MISPFEFATAGRIIFGDGAAARVAELASPFGTRIALVTGANHHRARSLLDSLEKPGSTILVIPVEHEPDLDLVRIATARAREAATEIVIAIGGGSVIDTGKAIAALLENPGDVLDYLEIIGRGHPLSRPSRPFIAVPTTAGTGAEATRNAVLTSTEHQAKVSLRSPFMLPRIAVVDPTLTLGLPPALTAATGLDALTQLIEPFLSCKATPFTDALCRDGIPRVARFLKRAFMEPTAPDQRDIEARREMALASLEGGIALANAGLGAAHGFAGPIGGMFPAPHGATCAALLPAVMELNFQALLRRSPTHPVLERFHEIARLVTGNPAVDADEGIRWLRGLCAELGVKPLRDYGISEADIPALVAKGRNSSSMKGNPILLEEPELIDILERSL